MTVAKIPTTAGQLDQVRNLMRALIDWHRLPHQEDQQFIDQYFDAATFDEELALLPGKYAPDAKPLHRVPSRSTY